MKVNDPIPKKIKVVQPLLSVAVGFLAMVLWHSGISGFIAFLITYSFVYVGIAVIYIKSQSNKKEK